MDFCFTGKAKLAASSNDVMMASMFFGVIGSLIASSGTNAVFEIKTDHLSGGFVRVKEVKPYRNKRCGVLRRP
jgi:hypothetical protein